MNDADLPVTPAIRLLREKSIPFRPHSYTYVEHGGTRNASASIGAPEHAVVKTLVMETDLRAPLLVLMHGDCNVSTKQLARHLGVKTVTPCAPDVAQKHTGYMIGGTSPLGTRKPLPVYAEAGIFALDRIYLNGGRRGLLVELAPADLRKAVEIQEVTVAVPTPA